MAVKTAQETVQALLKERLDARVANIKLAWGSNPTMLKLFNSSLQAVKEAADKGAFGASGISPETHIDLAVKYAKEAAVITAYNERKAVAKIAGRMLLAKGITREKLASFSPAQQQQIAELAFAEATKVIAKV